MPRAPSTVLPGLTRGPADYWVTYFPTVLILGVGMGLTVARHSMRNLGGEVILADRPGGGATCTIRHPLERRNK